MPFVSLLALFFSLHAAAPSPEPAQTDAAGGTTWTASGVVGADGALRLLPGWSVRIGLGGRAHLLGPAPRTPLASDPWDDEAIARGVRIGVRIAARDGDAVYVEGRLRQGARARSFLLRWDAASGAWSEAPSA